MSGGTPKSDNKEFYIGEIPFLTISDIDKNKYVEDTEKHISENGLNHSTAKIVPTGTVSLAMYASVGKVCILKKEMATSQAFLNMFFKNNNMKEFIYQRLTLANINEEWETYISTGTQRNLNAEKISNFKILIPKHEEQEKVALLFSSLDEKIELEIEKLEKLKQTKEAMLEKILPQEQAFTPPPSGIKQ